MLYYIRLFLIFALVECFNPDLSDEPRNYSREDVLNLFNDNFVWNQGDIPLLNKKIFKGMRVTIREHPYIASVRRHITHYSVATMLTKNMFVTVAHPLIDVPLDELGVVVGENYADRGATLLTVLLLIIHENFDPYTLYADLALIRVYEDTPYRCSVKSIQLVHPKATLNGHRGFVTGWGRCDRTGRELCLPRSSKYTPGEKFDPMLRTVSFIVEIPNPYCEGYKMNSVKLLPGMLCTGRAREEDRVSSCMAVPGAPLVVDAHLTAVLSWGFGCGYDNDLPLVYTSIQYYQPWLIHNIPLLRQLTQDNLTILFETKRAYILSKWLNMTRIVAPEPFKFNDKYMETLKLDRELAKLQGNVYDIRDFLFDGAHHNYKDSLYEKLRARIFEKKLIDKLHYISQISPVPFLNRNNTKTPNDGTTLKAFIENLQNHDVYRNYDDYI